MDCAFLMNDGGIDWSKWVSIIVPSFITLIGIVVSGLIGWSVTSVNKEQLKTAATKLKLDLYDRRYKIVDAVHALCDPLSGIASDLSHQRIHLPDLRKVGSHAQTLRSLINETEFLFSEKDQINLFLESLITRANAAVDLYSPLMQDKPLDGFDGDSASSKFARYVAAIHTLEAAFMKRMNIYLRFENIEAD